MSYDEKLATRISRILEDESHIAPKKMFGGIAFLFKGRMFCGLAKDSLMVRVGAEAHSAALNKPGARPMDFTGRPMKGYVFVAPEALKSGKTLEGWVRQGLTFVQTLKEPSKKATQKKPPLRRARPRTTR